MGKNKTSTSNQLERATYASITQGALVLWPAKTHGNLGARHHVPTREEDFANRRPAGLNACAPLVIIIIIIFVINKILRTLESIIVIKRTATRSCRFLSLFKTQTTCFVFNTSFVPCLAFVNQKWAVSGKEWTIKTVDSVGLLFVFQHFHRTACRWVEPVDFNLHWDRRFHEHVRWPQRSHHVRNQRRSLLTTSPRWPGTLLNTKAVHWLTMTARFVSSMFVCWPQTLRSWRPYTLRL